MDTKQVMIWSGIILAIILYFPLIAGILRETIKQNVTTWILWISLDLIAMISIIMQKGNYKILACYCTCGTVVIICLLYKKLFSWTRFESFVLTLVVICLIIWYFSGPYGATIASSIAVWISGCPQIRDSWRAPDRTTGFIYLGYAVANGLSFLGGKTWTVEDRFYPGLMVTLCLAIAFAAFRRPRSVATVHTIAQ